MKTAVFTPKNDAKISEEVEEAYFSQTTKWLLEIWFGFKDFVSEAKKMIVVSL